MVSASRISQVSLAMLAVPCLQRASTVEAYAETLENSTVEEDVEGGEWVATNTDQEEDAFEVLPTRNVGIVSADIPDVMDLGREDLEEEGSDDESSIPDVSSLTEQLQQQTRDSTSGGVKEESSLAKCTMKEEPPLPNSHILLTRTYDILISYDKHHAVPRVWLIGYGEDGAILPKEKVLEDIISDYRLRTVTMEPHPHHAQGGRIVSIHPCKHADVMKKFASMVVSSSNEGLADDAGQLEQSGQPSESEQSPQKREFPTEHYMILFLKFMSSVIPTIEYDFTLPAGL
jgi:ubiquitin-like-conjugating enzyme ATG3